MKVINSPRYFLTPCDRKFADCGAVFHPKTLPKYDTINLSVPAIRGLQKTLQEQRLIGQLR